MKKTFEFILSIILTVLFLCIIYFIFKKKTTYSKACNEYHNVINSCYTQKEIDSIKKSIAYKYNLKYTEIK